MTDLSTLGFPPAQFDPQSHQHQLARVVEERRGGYRVITASGELDARVSGRFRHQVDRREEIPAVGDWVAVELLPGEEAAIIHELLPRASALLRKSPDRRTDVQVLAANLDTVFVVTSCNRDFNPRRLERQLTLVWESGAQPVLVLTKADLCSADEIEVLRSEAEAVAPGVPVHVLAALRGEGLEELREYLVPRRTIAFLGSSGVGKSTLVNVLMGEERQATGGIREDDQRGRHTTVHRQLLVLPCGAMVIDTPGMREIALWDGEGLEAVFEDVDSLADECRFRDCTHQGEPGCAVTAALAEGDLPEERLASYRKLERELAFLERRQNGRAQLEEQRKWKRITVEQRKRRNANP